LSSIYNFETKRSCCFDCNFYFADPHWLCLLEIKLCYMPHPWVCLLNWSKQTRLFGLIIVKVYIWPFMGYKSEGNQLLKRVIYLTIHYCFSIFCLITLFRCLWHRFLEPLITILKKFLWIQQIIYCGIFVFLFSICNFQTKLLLFWL
jgi:hypothetical protein